MDCSADGEVNISPRDLAVIMDWNKDGEILMAALLENRWLENKNGGKFIHDWDEYSGKLLEKRELRRQSNLEAQRKRRAGLHSKQDDVSTLSALTGDDSQHSTVPNRTQPYSTVPGKPPVVPLSRGTAKEDEETKEKGDDGATGGTGVRRRRDWRINPDPDRFIKGRYGHLVRRGPDVPSDRGEASGEEAARSP